MSTLGKIKIKDCGAYHKAERKLSKSMCLCLEDGGGFGGGRGSMGEMKGKASKIVQLVNGWIATFSFKKAIYLLPILWNITALI